MFFRILRDIHAEPRLDPLVKVQWMKHVLSAGCQGSQPLRTAFEEHLALPESIDISDDVNWVDPQDTAAEQLRAACASVLSQLPDLTAAGAEAAQQFKSLETLAVPGRYQWVGTLFRDETGTWQVATRAAPGSEAGRLVILYRPTAEAAWLLKDVGEFTGERTSLSTADDTWLLEGCPVYAEILRVRWRRNVQH